MKFGNWLVITLCGVSFVARSAHAQITNSTLAAPIQQTIRKINESTKIPAEFKSKLIDKANSLLPMLSNPKNLGTVGLTNQQLQQTLAEAEAMTPRQQTIENLARLYSERFVAPEQTKPVVASNAVKKISDPKVRQDLMHKLWGLGFTKVTEDKIDEMVQRAPVFFNKVMGIDRGTLKVSDLPASELKYLEQALDRSPLDDSDLANLTKAVRGAVLDQGGNATSVAAAPGATSAGKAGGSSKANDIAKASDSKAAAAGDEVAPAGSQAAAENPISTSAQNSDDSMLPEQSYAPRNSYTPSQPAPRTQPNTKPATPPQAPATKVANNGLNGQQGDPNQDPANGKNAGTTPPATGAPTGGSGSVPTVTQVVHGRTLAGDDNASSGKTNASSSSAAPNDQDLALALSRQRYLQSMLDKMNAGDTSAHLNRTELMHELANTNTVIKAADPIKVKKLSAAKCEDYSLPEKQDSAEYNAQMQRLMKDASTKASLLSGYMKEAAKFCTGNFCKDGNEAVQKLSKDIIDQHRAGAETLHLGTLYKRGQHNERLDDALQKYQTYTAQGATPPKDAAPLDIRISALQAYINLSRTNKNYAGDHTDIFISCAKDQNKSPTKALERIEKQVRGLILNSCPKSPERAIAEGIEKFNVNYGNNKDHTSFGNYLGGHMPKVAGNPPTNIAPKIAKPFAGMDDKMFFASLPPTSIEPLNSTVAKCNQLEKFEAYAVAALQGTPTEVDYRFDKHVSSNGLNSEDGNHPGTQ